MAGQASPSFSESRDSSRTTLMLEAKFREYGSFRTEVYLLNLSVSGCRLESSLRIMPGQQVWLTLPDTETRVAYVRWSTGDAMGCQFVDPLETEIIERLAHQNPNLN